MFEPVERIHYARSPLLEVICQLRFPTILSIASHEPSDFQESIRKTFPRYLVRQEQPAPRVTGVGTPNPALQPQQPVTNYNFLSEDGVWRLNLTNSFIALTCQKYPGWEAFARKLDQPLASFIRIYQPAYFERVGLRYLNAISRESLGLTELPWRELLTPSFLGLLAEEDVRQETVARCTQDVEMSLDGGCRLRLHSGPGKLRRPGRPAEQETKWILDLDLSLPGSVPVNHSAPALQMLHMHSTPIFRAALTDTLHEALGPVSK